MMDDDNVGDIGRGTQHNNVSNGRLCTAAGVTDDDVLFFWDAGQQINL